MEEKAHKGPENANWNNLHFPTETKRSEITQLFIKLRVCDHGRSCEKRHITGTGLWRTVRFFVRAISGLLHPSFFFSYRWRCVVLLMAARWRQSPRFMSPTWPKSSRSFVKQVNIWLWFFMCDFEQHLPSSVSNEWCNILHMWSNKIIIINMFNLLNWHLTTWTVFKLNVELISHH